MTEANFLLVGETISEPGNWSSFPPHKHDNDNLPHETALEELYFFRFQPNRGFGFQRVYTEDRSLDELFLIEDDEVKLKGIPGGQIDELAGSLKAYAKTYVPLEKVRKNIKGKIADAAARESLSD